MDPPMATFSKNDGMISLPHCQEWNILCPFFHSNMFLLFKSWNFCESENSINSSNVNHLPNALHIHSSDRSWFAFSIRAPTKANDIYAESRLERKKLTLYSPFPKWVTVLRRFAKKDVEENLNVIMSTVSGTLKNNMWMAYIMRHIVYSYCTIELNNSTNGYDAGFTKDEYGCNLNTCECAEFDQVVIGKLESSLEFFA